MSFGEPLALILLLLLPLLAWMRKRISRPSAFLYSSVNLVKHIAGLRGSPAAAVLRGLRWCSLFLLIAALSQPRFHEGRSIVSASGVDIVVALDLSGSMAAEDFELNGQRVNRVAIAKNVLKEFIEKRPNDRIGLVAFAGQAYIASPLTLDHDFLETNLNRLDLNLQMEDGTAIGSAITSGLNRLRKIESKSKILILMTDGQNTAGKVPPMTAAEAAETLGVKIYTIGVGTRGQAPMPQNVFGRKRYVQVPVDIDEETLRTIADKTGGIYYRADSSDTLRRIYAEIDELEKTEVTVKQYQRYDELFPWLVLPGMILLLLEIALSHTVWRKLP